MQSATLSTNLTKLPIDTVRNEVVEALDKNSCVILEASPGAGKTTRVPLWAMQRPWVQGREIWMLAPRRLAVRLAANRLAEALGEEVGQRVGYQFRFESRTSEQTILRLMTEGMFLHLLRQDRDLKRVAMVILDEFHERHLPADIALTLLRRQQLQGTHDLRLLIMSATLQAQELKRYLPEAARVQCPTAIFPLSMQYRPLPREKRFSDHATVVVREALNNNSGDLLVFLPGQREINELLEILQQDTEVKKVGAVVMPLFADLTKDEQAQVFSTQARRKIVLSTNVAESSITLPGVRVVIDSGLQRTSDDTSSLGYTTLRIRSCPKSSCIQRAGRAAREAPGTCYRLYSESDFQGRAAFDRPEIQRSDLSETILQLLSLGIDAQALPWFDPPHPQALERARQLLCDLGAIETPSAKTLTTVGADMAPVNLPVRLARLWCALPKDANKEANDEWCFTMALAIALLSDERGNSGARGESRDDLEESWLVTWQRGLPLNRECKKIFQRLWKGAVLPFDLSHARQCWQRLVPLFMLAYPDRVAKRLNDQKIILCFGEQAQLSSSWPESIQYFLCFDLDESDRGTHRMTFASRLIGLDQDRLLEHPRLLEKSQYSINPEQMRLEELSGLYLGKVALLEERRVPRGKEEAGGYFWRDVLQHYPQWLTQIFGEEWWAMLWPRHALVLKFFAQENWPTLPAQDDVVALASILTKAFPGIVELKACADGAHARQNFLQAWLDAEASRWQRLVPESMAIPGRKDAPIRYLAGQDPILESRMQDFFSLPEGPRILDGRLALVISFLAPNYRSVQMTQDLKGFWQRHYPALKKELGRRYPRHFWPDNPLQAPPRDPNKKQR